MKPMQLNSLNSIIIILIVFLSVFSCSGPKDRISKVDKNLSNDILMEYGEYVYQREDCSSCHTLSILEESATLISLDGNKGYRSPVWMYLFLQNPKEMMSGTTMPSYSHLSEVGLSKGTLSKVLKNKGVSSSKSIDEYWLKLNEQVDEYQVNLESLRYSTSTELISSELIPLVAFLQRIPPSEHLMYLDSLEAVKQKEKEQVLEYYYQHSDSIIDSFSSRSESLTRGGKLYATNCTVCHGEKAQGLIGPNLIDEYWITGSDNESKLKIIMEGNQNGMPNYKYKLSPKEAVEIVVYIQSLEGTVQPNPKAPQGIKK
jgi:mono/diheme cytochrome c family protein